MKQINKFAFLIFILFQLFSCTADTNSSVVQENTVSHSKFSSFIITVYSQENSLDIWQYAHNKYEIKASSKLADDLFLPLGIQEINRISNDEIIIDLPTDQIASKLKAKFELKTNFLDSIIPLSIADLQQPILKEDYTLLVLPSKPNEYGYSKGCFSCPFSEQEMYLKAQLEWENIFGQFKEIPKENISDAN